MFVQNIQRFLSAAHCYNFETLFIVYLLPYQGTSVLSPMVPLLLFVVPALMVAWKSAGATIFISNPVLYMFTFGFVATRVTNRLVVSGGAVEV